MASCLVTGGAGFIGSHLARRLVSEGHAVRVLDVVAGGVDRLADVRGKIEYTIGDLRDADGCQGACEGIELVFHQAAMPSVPRSVADPVTSHDVNVNGTFNMLMAAREAKCRRFIYAASSSAYGDTKVSPKHEGLIPEPLSPYAAQKLTGEYYCRVFFESFGLETLSIRYFNVFGPFQDPKSQYAAAIPAFVTAILSGERPTVYGDGEQTRDFTYIDNAVQANLLAANAKRVCGQVINCACGRAVSINHVIGRINELLGKDVAPVYAAPRAGDVRHSLADVSRAKELIGYTPLVDFDEGLRRAIEYYASLERNEHMRR